MCGLQLGHRDHLKAPLRTVAPRRLELRNACARDFCTQLGLNLHTAPVSRVLRQVDVGLAAHGHDVGAGSELGRGLTPG